MTKKELTNGFQRKLEAEEILFIKCGDDNENETLVKIKWKENEWVSMEDAKNNCPDLFHKFASKHFPIYSVAKNSNGNIFYIQISKFFI